MKSIEYFFELIKKSDISLLGYTFKQEKIKDEIISKLSYLMVPEINSYFSFKSFLRDLKIQSIMDDNSVNNPEYLLLDLDNIIFKSDDLESRQKQIGNIIGKIREDLYSCTYSQKLPYRLLILNTLYSSGENVDTYRTLITNFSGGAYPVYMSDVVILMQDKSMKVIKNRFDDNINNISYTN